MTEEVRARLRVVFGDGVDLDAWLSQFDPADRGVAQSLVERAHFISQSEVRARVRSLHERVLARARADGITSFTYARMFTAKSGDLVSYYYRSANLIPANQFRDADHLAACPFEPDPTRALVIVDDYAGTGAQFLTEFTNPRRLELFARYGRVYLAVIAAHARAIDRFARLNAGDHASVVAELTKDFGNGELDPDHARETVGGIDGGRTHLIYDLEDRGFDLGAADERVLRASAAFARSPRAPYGTAGLRASVGFFYGPPNGMPDVFWNTLGTRDGHPFRPLLTRTEDISNYEFARGLSPDQQTWGGPR